MKNTRKTHSICQFVVWIVLLTGCGPPDQLPELVEVSTQDFLPSVAQQIDSLQTAVNQDPGSGRHAGRLGMAYLVYEQNHPAEVALRRARLLQPDHFEWTYYNAEALTRLGRYAEAVSLLEVAVRSRPDHVLARARLALLHMQLGDLEPARLQLLAIHNEQPGNDWVRLGLARVYLRADQPEQARLHLEYLVENAAPAGGVYFALADVAKRAGEIEKAGQYLALFEKYRGVDIPEKDPLMGAMQAMDRSGLVLLRAAQQLAQAGQTEKATVFLNRALEQNPGSQMTHVALINAYAGTRQFGKANEHYRLALDSGPASAPLLRNIGRVRVMEDRLPEALELLQQALELDPGDSGALAWMGIAFLKQNRVPESLEKFAEAIENNPQELLARHNLANLLHNLGRHEEALGHLERLVVVEDPTSPRVWRQIGVSNLQLGRREQAREALLTAVASAGKFSDAVEAAQSRKLLQELGQ